MKIGLISDTRVRRGEEVPPEVIRAFEGVELIIHAGNIYSPDVLDWLEQIAPVKAVGRIQGGQYESNTPFAVQNADAVVTPINNLMEVFNNVVFSQDWHPVGHKSFYTSHENKKPFETTHMSYFTGCFFKMKFYLSTKVRALLNSDSNAISCWLRLVSKSNFFA